MEENICIDCINYATCYNLILLNKFIESAAKTMLDINTPKNHEGRINTLHERINLAPICDNYKE